METKDWITIIISSLALISGLIGMVTGVLSYVHNKSQTVNSFFEHTVNHQLSDARKFVYNLPDGVCISNDSPDEMRRMIGEIVNFYDHWGMVAKKRHLPFWVFYCRKDGLTAAGISVIRLYQKLEPSISDIRNQNSKYASYFQQLYDKLKPYDVPKSGNEK